MRSNFRTGPRLSICAAALFLTSCLEQTVRPELEFVSWGGARIGRLDPGYVFTGHKFTPLGAVEVYAWDIPVTCGPSTCHTGEWTPSPVATGTADASGSIRDLLYRVRPILCRPPTYTPQRQLFKVQDRTSGAFVMGDAPDGIYYSQSRCSA